MKKLFFLFVVLMITTARLTAQKNAIQNIYGRNVQSLNGNWHYIIDPLKTGDDRKFYENRQQQTKDQLLEYDFKKSSTLQVPGDWNSQDKQLLFYEGTIWYQRDFVVAIKPNKKYFLYFGAVNYEAEVYVNGQKVGTHTGGFTPFQFEITSLLNNGNNFVVVRANNTRKKEAVPTENFDWWNYGGITRDVFIVETATTFVNDYSVQLSRDDAAMITGFVQLEGDLLSQEVTIQVPEINLRAKIKTDATGKAIFMLPAKNIQYWSPGHPKLYTVVITSAEDTVKDKIGFRTIAIKENEILVNGKAVFLRGICMHEENPSLPGRPRSKDQVKRLLQWARELNCNFIRLAHYPYSEWMSRLADEAGVMLWEEVPVYWSIDWGNNDTYENAKQQLTELIGRDKNRASVLVWSIGNETPYNETREIFMEGLADHAHMLDSTRPVSAALLGHIENKTFRLNDRLAEKLDIVSFNEYIGWYTGVPQDINQYQIDLNTNKPVMVTEFGGDALGGFHADSATRFSEEFQETIFKKQLQLISTIKGLSGITPWLLVDFKSPKRINPTYQQYWNRKGLISAEGKKKKAFYILKEFYDSMQKKSGSD